MVGQNATGQFRKGSKNKNETEAKETMQIWVVHDIFCKIVQSTLRINRFNIMALATSFYQGLKIAGTPLYFSAKVRDFIFAGHVDVVRK